MNNSINSRLKQLVIAILATQGVAFTANAANVPISPIITGAQGGYSEDEGNMWFSVDNTCSMYFWADYNDSITYELPIKPDGSKMPMPRSNQFTSTDPFLGVVGATSSGGGCEYWKKDYANDRLFEDRKTVCGDSKHPDDDNCRIWLKYYSDRMRTLKSTMSLAFFSPKGKELLSKLRVGYESYSESFKSSNNWLLKPMYDIDGIVGDEEQNALHKWIFGVYPDIGRTPLKAPMSLLDKIQKKSKKDEAGNPFLVNPTKAYAKDSNEKKICRRNSLLMLTDGQWDILYKGDTDPYSTDNLASNYPNIANVRVTNNYNLPDGKQYNGSLAPYANQRSRNASNIPTLPSGESRNNFQVMADIALAAWKTDLDGDSSTDKLEPMWYDENNIPKLVAAGGSDENQQYWHPLNDPATWQHINTFTMGFNVKRGQCADTSKPWCVYDGSGGIVDWSTASGETVIPTIANLGDFNTYLGITDARKFDLENFGGYSRILNVSKDLANTAMVGRGRYYQVEKPSELVEGFKDLLDRGGKTIAIPAKTGSSGVAGNSKNAGNSYFSSRYDAAIFNGELMKYKLFDGNSANANSCFGATPSPLPVAGTACKVPEWNVGKTLAPTQWTSREIITAKVDGSTHEIVDFKPSEISATQKTTLKDNFPTALSGNFTDDAERYTKLFSYVKGDGEQEQTGKFRSRKDYEFVDGSKARNIFGAIVRSSPVFAGLPTAYTAHLDKSKNAYTKYIEALTNFKAANANGASEIIYVAANDGMLHAIKANDGKEVFAYVPNATYENLPKTVEPKKQISLNDGNIDVQLVNFGIDETDDNNNDNWQRVLVGSMGGGAKGLYALNVSTPTADKVKLANKGNWEFSADADMGNIMAKPAIIQLQDNTWAAVVGNGYNATNNKAVLFVINLDNGKLIQKLEMPAAFATGSANGLGPLYFASHPNKAINKRNYYDRAYAGDLQGNLWVFDLSNATKAGGITVVNDKPLFTAKATVGATEIRQPITVAPKVVKHPLGYGNLVHFGTGALFDRDDLSSKVPNSIYGIWDDWIAKDKGGLPEATPRDETVQGIQLNPVVLKNTTVKVAGKDINVRYLDSKNKATAWKIPGTTGTYRGWKVDLLTSGGYERAWQPAQTAYGSGNSEVISYNTVRYVKKASTSDCTGDGSDVESWQLVFNPEDFARGLSAQGALDLNKDGKYDNADITKADGSALISEGGKTIIPIGEATVGSINYNSSDQDIDEGSTTQSGCRLNRQTKSNSSSGTTGVTVQRCAYFSSWKELK